MPNALKYLWLRLDEESRLAARRVGYRSICAVLLAAMAPVVFAEGLLVYFLITSVFCVAVAVSRLEPFYRGPLNHWDEAAMLLGVCALLL
jgi:hypothetical protein